MLLGTQGIQSIIHVFCFLGHINNQYNTCFWMLVKCGKTEEEAQEVLKVLVLFIYLFLFVYIYISIHKYLYSPIFILPLLTPISIGFLIFVLIDSLLLLILENLSSCSALFFGSIASIDSNIVDNFCWVLREFVS